MSISIPDPSIQEQMLRDLSGLIKIPSVKGSSSPGAPYGEQTLSALEYLLSLGRQMGFAVRNLDGYAGFVEFGSGEYLFAVLCHLDVVPAAKGWDFDPFIPVIADDRLIGRGAIDDKGPAIAVLYAMKSLMDEGFDPGCRIRLILGLDEESGFGCMEYYKSVEKIPDLGFTPDSKFPVIFAEKGILHLTIGGRFPVRSHSSMQARLLSISGGERANMIPAECTFSYIIGPLSNKQIVTETVRGKTGHASLPELGENAISKAVVTLAEFFCSLESTHPFLEFYTDCIHTETDGTRLGIACKDVKTGSLTCNVGLISCTEENVSVTLDIRYPIRASKDYLIKTICERIEPYGLGEVSHSGLDPLYVDPESGFIQVLLGVYNNFTNQKESPISIGGGTYARSIPNIVAYGPVFDPDHDVAHQSGEYIKLNELMDCYHIYREAIRKSCEFLMSNLTCQL